MQEWLPRIEGCRSLAELWRLVRTYYRGLGFGAVAYLVPRRAGTAAGDGAELAVIHHGFPPEIAHAYLEASDRRLDVVPRFAMTQGVAMRWSQIWTLAAPDAEQRAFLEEMRAVGFGDGFALPVFGPLGRNALVQVGRAESEAALDAAPVSQMQMFAQAAHLHLCTLMPVANPLDRPLSARELEILDWVAKGKSNAVIADILDLSKDTVDTYLRRIYEKLDVSDRTSAAVRGVGMGLIAA